MAEAGEDEPSAPLHGEFGVDGVDGGSSPEALIAEVSIARKGISTITPQGAKSSGIAPQRIEITNTTK